MVATGYTRTDFVPRKDNCIVRAIAPDMICGLRLEQVDGLHLFGHWKKTSPDAFIDFPQRFGVLGLALSLSFNFRLLFRATVLHIH